MGQVMKVTQDQLEELLASGELSEADIAAIEDAMAEAAQTPTAPAKAQSKISIGVHAKSSASLPQVAVDVAQFVKILQMNLDLDFAVDVSVGVNPTLAVPDAKGSGASKSSSIGFQVAVEPSQEDVVADE